MHFSCKITNSILTYFEKHLGDPADLLEVLDFPEEFLRDPSYWVGAEQMEFWLEKISRHHLVSSSEDFLFEIGTESSKLRTWGVLDSVLRMMQKPEDMLAQPSRFLGYFIAPEPPVENILRQSHRIEFDLPVSSQQYPYTTSFLRGAFAGLPSFVGKTTGECSWDQLHLTISWSANEAALLSEEENKQFHLSPELMRSIIQQLEENQKSLEVKNRELLQKNEALLQAQNSSSSQHFKDLAEFSRAIATDLQVPAQELRQNISRLHDYLVRAQQLITVLATGHKQSPALKEAFRRLDWEKSNDNFKEAWGLCEESLRKIQSLSRNLHDGQKQFETQTGSDANEGSRPQAQSLKLDLH